MIKRQEKFSNEEWKIANKYFKKDLFISILRNRNESNNQIFTFQKDTGKEKKTLKPSILTGQLYVVEFSWAEYYF